MLQAADEAMNDDDDDDDVEWQLRQLWQLATGHNWRVSSGWHWTDKFRLPPPPHYITLTRQSAKLFMQNLRRQLKMNLREIKITKAEMTELL